MRYSKREKISFDQSLMKTYWWNIIFKMHSKIDTDLFIEAWKMELALWNVKSEESKNRNTRTKSLKKFVDQFNVSRSLVIIYYYFVFSFCKFSFLAVLMQRYNKLLFGKFEENLLIFLERAIETKINTLRKRISQNYKRKSWSGTNNNVESKWKYFNGSHFYVTPSKQKRSIRHWQAFIQTCRAMETFQMYWNRDKSYLWCFCIGVCSYCFLLIASF